MGVDHGRLDAGMAQKILDGPDVDSAFEEVGGEGMPQAMAGGSLGDSGLGHRGLELAAHGIGVEMMASDASCPGVGAELRGGKDILPDPLPGGGGKLAQEGFRQVGFPLPGGQVAGVGGFGERKVVPKRSFNGSGQGHRPVLAALALVHGDGALSEVQILDPETHGLGKAQAASIHDLGGEPPWILQIREHMSNLIAGEHHRRAASAASGVGFLQNKLAESEDMAEQEDHGIQRLFLSRRRNIPFQGQVVQVGGDSGRSGLLRGLAEAHEAEAGEADVPVDIGGFGGIGQPAEAGGAADFVGDAGGFGDWLIG